MGSAEPNGFTKTLRRLLGRDLLSWTTLLLRFDEGAFVVAHGDGRNHAEVIAPQAGK